MVENTVEKGEIACKSNFPFAHDAFKRTVLHTGKDKGLFGKGIRVFFTILVAFAASEHQGQATQKVQSDL